ncbi:hypothetical protein NLJ89_g5630 [Agrocybe chaxingu]|uniref:Uncharacterized protein n=1 Tax=Agrocybe chaxingu TaxID=84603 RepID=A0A9W8K7Z4_9AGAR|nr:hypothetical protein NLJ89_g5630 [Agrocybe chaxingu]
MAPYDMLLEKPLFVMQQQMQQQQQVFGTPRYTPPVPQHPVSSGTPLQSYSPNPSMHAPSSSRSSASGTPIPAGAVSGGTPLQSYNPYPPAPGPSRLSGTPPVAFSAPPVVSSAPVVVPSAPSVAPPTSAVVSSDAPPVASLKRDSFSMVDGHGREEESQKKARLESPVFQPEPVQLAPSYPEPQTSITPPSSPAAVPPTSLPPPPPGPSSPILALAEEAPTTTNLPPPPPPPPPPAQDEDQEMEDEEEGEGLVEVGPDGLRLVKDCLEELFEEDEDSPGHRMCRLCTVRHQKGLISEPPTAFVNATDEELEAHCLAEHDQVWEVLRKVGG